MNLIYDSYHRSGSHFFMSSFLTAFPEHEISWGRHDLSWLQNDGMVTVVRNPVDAIASHLKHYFGAYTHGDAVSCIEINRSWLMETNRRKSAITVVDFNSLVADPYAVVSDIGSSFGLVAQPFSTEQIWEILTPSDPQEAHYIPSPNRRQETAAIGELLENNHSDELEELVAAYRGVFNA